MLYDDYLVRNNLQCGQSDPVEVYVRNEGWEAFVTVFGSSGELVDTLAAGGATEGYSTFAIDTTDYTVGLYFLQARAGASLYHAKFIVTR